MSKTRLAIITLRDFIENNYQALFRPETSRLSYCMGLIAHTYDPNKVSNELLILQCTQCIGYLCALKDLDKIRPDIADNVLEILHTIKDSVK